MLKFIFLPTNVYYKAVVLDNPENDKIKRIQHINSFIRNELNISNDGII